MRQEIAGGRKSVAAAGVPELLSRGLQEHRAGRVAAAEALYREALALQPGHPDALHLTGMAALDLGRAAEAVAWIGAAIAARGDVAAFHNNLGLALARLGRHREASLACARALELQPDYAEALINLGNALQALGRPEQAAERFREALAVRPASAEARNNLGNALAACGLLEEAAGWLRSAVEQKPDYAEAWLNLSGVLKQQGRLEEGVECCRRAIRLAPAMGEAFSNLGALLAEGGLLEPAEAAAREALARKPGLVEPLAVLAAVRQTQGRHAEAEQYARRALAARPDYAVGWNALANALAEQARAAEAEACLNKALEIDPRLADAHYNLANLRRAGLRLEEAAAGYRRALALRPNHVKAHWNLALTLLLAGDLEHGWEHYEWRWRKHDSPMPHFAQPAWDGTPLEGRSLLIWHEQGLGDTIHFIRYASAIDKRGGRLIVECPEKLAALIATAPGVDEVVAAGGPRPAFDMQAPMGSLPRLCRTTAATIPGRVPYLSADGERRAAWRDKLSRYGRPRVALVWRGNPLHAEDRQRSVDWTVLAPLGEVRSVCWFALNYGHRPGTLGAAEVIDLGPETADFRDAAAAVEQMDLVISVDTALAHLAGALARPVWLLLPYVPDWRWMCGRPDSPWYPTARLFRQSRPGDWEGVAARVAAALGEEFSKAGGGGRYAW